MARFWWTAVGAALLVASTAGACGDGGPVDVPPGAARLADQEVQPILAQDWSGIPDRDRSVLRSQEAWEAFWARVFGVVAPTPAAPTVDFAAHMVVTATMGEQPSGGHEIRIAGVHRDGEDLWVEVVEARPGSRCVVIDVLTRPVIAVRVPRTGGTVHFVERKVVADC